MVGEKNNWCPLCAPFLSYPVSSVLAFKAGEVSGCILVGVEHVQNFLWGGRACAICCVECCFQVCSCASFAYLVVFEEGSASLVHTECHHCIPLFWCVFPSLCLAEGGGCHTVPPCWGDFCHFLLWLLCGCLRGCGVVLGILCGGTLFADEDIDVISFVGFYVHVLRQLSVVEG